MKGFAVLALGLAASTAIPQTAASARPVTRQEFLTAAWKLERAANRVLGMKEPEAPKVADPSRPLKRSEVILTLDALFKAYRPRFQCTPRPHPLRSGHIAAHNGPEVRGPAERLAKWGFLAPVGFIVTGPSETVTARQAGDALGTFFNQLSVCAHEPDVRWSPNIMSGG
ncbi:MAG: hypothetical protein JST30_06460 [Armatimonadetes bacterium]|nr:hypothetical protein [Armatimonadota bacterium]